MSDQMVIETMEISVPDIGDFNLEDGVIAEVMIKVGDSIEPEQPLFTVEYEHCCFDVTASHGGEVLEIKVKSGVVVHKGTPILLLKPNGAVAEWFGRPPQVSRASSTTKPVKRTSLSDVNSTLQSIERSLSELVAKLDELPKSAHLRAVESRLADIESRGIGTAKLVLIALFAGCAAIALKSCFN
jgi:pyruvate/2-oxoglutarate dehydrogenase complex dihydrolipoamide acyltransferase (E2) component